MNVYYAMRNIDTKRDTKTESKFNKSNDREMNNQFRNLMLAQNLSSKLQLQQILQL